VKYNIKKLVRHEDVDKGGILKSNIFFMWVYNEIIKHAESISGSKCLIRYISKVDIVNPAKKDDILEVKITSKSIGKSSLSFEASVISAKDDSTFLTIKNIIAVSVDSDLKSKKHEIESAENSFIPYTWVKYDTEK
tara:strand:+ start:3533 stop:3940 length:408 start_codon:yes stop_codon:yes gene_type:complete